MASGDQARQTRGSGAVWRRAARLGCALALVSLAAACAAGRAFNQAEEFALIGNWDAAVEYYRRALQEDPDRPEYRIALERAMLTASRAHHAQAAAHEEQGNLTAAILEYRKAAEFDPSNRQAAQRAALLERRVRENLEAALPPPAVEQMRDEARRQTEPPLLNPASREPIDLRFTNASTQDILDFLASATGINITYERDFRPAPFSIELEGVTLEEALDQLMTANQLWYKVINNRTIMVIPDTPQKRQQYEELVVRTFYVSHADTQELAQLLTQVLRFPGGVVPFVSPSPTTNTITVRATAPVANIMERIIEANDKPPAEIVVDVEILEVNRDRAKTYGLNLSNYAIGTIFSPEVVPDLGAEFQPPFNLNTITQGVSPADFYLTVPQALVRFLETDASTRLVAKPQLRGAEGQQLTLNLGDEIPVPSTVFTPLAAGGSAANPLTSFTYRPVGVNIEMTPRVTFEGEIILDITVENSTLGQSIDVAGSSLPTFGSRRVTTRLRLREGESNLLAGLIREEDRRALRGFPGVMRLPVFRQLLSNNETSVEQTDIVMLLTPHIVRTHELTQEDLNPIYIGTQRNVGQTGPPPLIAPVAGPAAPETPPATEPTAPRPPAGTSPIPGMTTEPQPVPPPAAPAEPPLPSAEPSVAPPPDPQPAVTDAAQIIVTPPTVELRAGGGPYTVPLSINGASRLSLVSLSLRFDPSVLRVQSVQEGSFMRQGNVAVTFSQQADATAGRLDVSIARTDDVTGASGSGLLAAVLFEAVGGGTTNLSLSGVATSPEGVPVPLDFPPTALTVR